MQKGRDDVFFVQAFRLGQGERIDTAQIAIGSVGHALLKDIDHACRHRLTQDCEEMLALGHAGALMAG